MSVACLLLHELRSLCVSLLWCRAWQVHCRAAGRCHYAVHHLLLVSVQSNPNCDLGDVACWVVVCCRCVLCAAVAAAAVPTAAAVVVVAVATAAAVACCSRSS